MNITIELIALVDHAEVSFMLENMLAACIKSKPDDPIGFALQYFEKVKSGTHIIGSDYGFIGVSEYNKRCFVHLLENGFSGISSEDEMTATDFQQLVEIISQDIPKASVLESCYIVPQIPNSSPTRYLFLHLKISLYFHILFEEWLVAIEKIFQERGTMNYLNISVIKAALPSIVARSQPSTNLTDVVLHSLSTSSSLRGGEISFDEIRRAIITSSTAYDEVTRFPLYCSSVVDSS